MTIQQNIYHGTLYLDSSKRWSLKEEKPPERDWDRGEIQFTSGMPIDLRIADQWLHLRIEHGAGEYYATDGETIIQLHEGMLARYVDTW